MGNFRPSVRPVPIEVHLAGFPGKHYCPRMQTMNKPTFAAIDRYSPFKPVLVFVSSRRQTRLTAFELINYCTQDDNPYRFLTNSKTIPGSSNILPQDEMEAVCATVRDQALRRCLAFGIGIHHGGLSLHDRKTAESLFLEGKIQVLVCTATLAWGVNLPAHLVILKGTEFFDGKTSRYVDYPITDVLRMMGRAGRPQFDDKGVACILVHEPKKNFYRKFLYEPFPVESQLGTPGVLQNHILAEICDGRIFSILTGVDYLTWTYYFRRLLVNPTYYGLDDSSPEAVKAHLLVLVEKCLEDLRQNNVIEDGPDGTDTIVATEVGKIASKFYVDYRTAFLFLHEIQQAGEDIEESIVCRLLSDAQEFHELPVRHNEEILNEDLAELCKWPSDMFDSPHTKAFLLLQARLQHIPLPIQDYATDTKSVMDQAPRVLGAMSEIARHVSNNSFADIANSLRDAFENKRKSKARRGVQSVGRRGTQQRGKGGGGG